MRLGPYEILARLGAGGMGEVYRARDTRLGRDVAIKVLAQHLSSNPDLKMRFEREARAISSLQHPHICTLFDVGHEGETDYLVMELLEGETLAERLRKGPLPQAELLKVGAEIASALEKAHRQGVVHRDLKPGNIMVTKSGAKLMDFGLAKAATAGKAAAAPAFSATMSEGVSPITASGTIVGTVQYMSPEQVEGKDADARSDIFAMGAVLYEMATGKRAFEGKSQISIASAILEKDPEPISAVKRMSPPALDFVVRTCLAKDPEARFQTAHDVELQLEWIGEDGSQAGFAAPIVSRRRYLERLAWGAIAALLLIAVGFGAAYWRWRSPQQAVTKSYLLPPQKHSFGASGLPGAHMAISHDGRKVVYVASSGNTQQLWLQLLDAPEPRPLPGTEGATYPFWSPDSRTIGFFADGKLKRVDTNGGPAQNICDVGSARGGTWNAKGTIVFASSPGGPLSAVSASGGAPRQASQLDKARGESGHRWPWFLPDGHHFLFTGQTGRTPESQGIFVGSLDSPGHKLVLAVNSNSAYAPPGYLLFLRDGSLMAQPFNLRRLEVEGEAIPIDEKIQYAGNFSLGDFSVSSNGTLVYVHGTNLMSIGDMAWYDRTGKSGGQSVAVGNGPSLSADGKMLALEEPDANGVALWLQDLVRNVKTRFTFSNPYNFTPVWSPDGTQIVFVVAGGGIWIKPVNGSAPERLLLKTGGTTLSWSRDGRYVLYRQVTENGIIELWALPMQAEKKPFPVVQVSSHNIPWADFSPDGKWVVYQSDESGTAQVYVAPFSGVGGRWQVSTDGGSQPLWRGDEIFFLNNGKVWAADARPAGATVQLGSSHALFSASMQFNPERRYDVTRDGKRFVVDVKTEQEGSAPASLVQNWTAGLKK